MEEDDESNQQNQQQDDILAFQVEFSFVSCRQFFGPSMRSTKDAQRLIRYIAKPFVIKQ